MAVVGSANVSAMLTHTTTTRATTDQSRKRNTCTRDDIKRAFLQWRARDDARLGGVLQLSTTWPPFLSAACPNYRFGVLRARQELEFARVAPLAPSGDYFQRGTV